MPSPGEGQKGLPESRTMANLSLKTHLGRCFTMTSSVRERSHILNGAQYVISFTSSSRTGKAHPYGRGSQSSVGCGVWGALTERSTTGSFRGHEELWGGMLGGSGVHRELGGADMLCD